MKATAIAHPIQGLLKYHGFSNRDLRIPLHDSISVCVAPYETRTTVEVRPDLEADVFEIDGQVIQGTPYQRAKRITDYLRQRGGFKTHIYMQSRNNFLSNIGLGASSSGFAALAVAASAAYGIQLTPKQLSAAARLGAGSATRAVAGGYAQWYAGTTHESSYAECIGTAETLPLGIIMAIIPAYKTTDDAHEEVLTSPYLPCRIAHAKAGVDLMAAAIKGGDFTQVCQMAERDSLALHAVTMTGNTGVLHWQPATLAVFHEVRQLRSEGLECYFSIDTGATPYINCRPQDRQAVAERIAALGVEIELGEVGGPARLVDEHLF
jgi:phosphomevalonate decarboxylase